MRRRKTWTQRHGNFWQRSTTRTFALLYPQVATMIPKADMSGWFVEREDEHLWPGEFSTSASARLALFLSFHLV